MQVRGPLSVAFIGFLLVTTLSVGATGTALAVDPAGETVDDVPSSRLASALAGQTTPQNNTTASPHRDPDNYSSQGDLQSVQRWLAGRMGETLVDCANATAARRFGVCDLDRKYPDWAEKYVDLARETQSNRDDQAATAFKQAGETQQSFAEETRSFRETYRAYQAAREAGNTARARQLARQLRDSGRRLNRTADTLQSQYARIENRTDLDLSQANESVEHVRQNVTAIVAEVESDVFVATVLTVSGNATRISFRDPLVLTGQLRTINGTPLINRVVQFTIADRTFRTRTNSEGNFTIRYRPTTVSITADQLTARYRPQNDSVYLPSQATIPVELEQVTATVTATINSTARKFGERLLVEGRISVDETPVSSIPIRTTFAGSSRTSRSNPTGSYGAEFRIPATVSPGRQTVSISILEGRAIRGAASTTVTVKSSSTTLTLNASQENTRTIRAIGHLTTADGTPVPRQSVQFRLNGTPVETTRTNRTGWYTATVKVPDRLLNASGNGTVALEVHFDGRETNLESANNTTVVNVATPPKSPPQGLFEGGIDVILAFLNDPVATIPLLGWRAWFVLLTVVGGGVMGALAWRRKAKLRQRFSALYVGVHSAISEGNQRTGPSVSENEESAAEAPTETDTITPQDYARQQLAAGRPDDAVKVVYGATREQFADTLTIDPTATHREFLEAVQSRFGGEDAAAFERLTEAYETAAFAATIVTEDAAREALEIAQQLQHARPTRTDGDGRTSSPESDSSD